MKGHLRAEGGGFGRMRTRGRECSMAWTILMCRYQRLQKLAGCTDKYVFSWKVMLTGCRHNLSLVTVGRPIHSTEMYL